MPMPHIPLKDLGGLHKLMAVFYSSRLVSHKVSTLPNIRHLCQSIYIRCVKFKRYSIPLGHQVVCVTDLNAQVITQYVSLVKFKLTSQVGFHTLGTFFF